MRIKLFLLVFVVLALTPVFAIADCNNQGVTVIYINGIFYSNQDAAKGDKDSLEDNFKKIAKRSDVKFLNGFNPSHTNGISDLVESTAQAYLGGGLDYDLTKILQQVHDELSTRKVLLVGHSQGTFYTNAAYDYLVSHGVSKDSIAVYNIATPANSVAGGGRYVTSSSDKLINFIVRGLALVGLAKKPLPANISIPLDDEQKSDTFGGHSLSAVYLKSVPDKIVGDMQKSIENLSALPSSSTGTVPVELRDCFDAPKMSLVNQIQGAAVVGGDEISGLYQVVKTSAVNTALAVGNGIKIAVVHAYELVKTLPGSAFVADLSTNQNAVLRVSNTRKTEYVVDESAAGAVLRPSEASSEGGAPDAETAAKIVVDPTPITNPPAGGPTPNPQDQIDDLLERIDLLNQQIADAQKAAQTDVATKDQNDAKVILTDANIDEDEVVFLAGAQEAPIEAPKTFPAGGVVSPVYAKILISEAQTAGTSDSKEEFVELYNPNDHEVDLTDWYLQRKTKSATSFSTYAPSKLFTTRTISAKGYFLIVRQGVTFYQGSTLVGDVYADNPLTDDNTLALKNPNGEISDKVGFGVALDFEATAAPNPPVGQSAGRSVSETDTDNNAGDFAFNVPTPRAQNVVYVAPVTPVAPTIPVTPVTPVTTGTVPVEPAVPEPPKKILINEIQTAGATVKDEFIELYNPNNVDVDLAGFALKKKTSTGTESNLVSSGSFSGTIKAGAYFLIAPQDDADGTKNYMGLGAPDLRYSGSSFSLASNNTVLLYAADGTLLDKVGFGTAKDFETATTANPADSKSIERKKPGQDSDDNSSDFTVSNTPTPGGTFPKTTLTDATDYSQNPGSNVPGAPMYNLLIKWQSPSANIASYQVQYQLNGGAWADWLATTTKTQEYFPALYSLFDDYSYSFRGRASDSDGNVGSFSPTVTIDLVNPVVINEVAWAGTGTDAADQWVELHNRSDKDVDLAGWHLVSGTNNVTTFNVALSGIIPSKGYLVIPKDATNTLGKNYLKLRAPNNRYVDEFYAPSAGLSESSFIISGSRYSMERVSSYAFGATVRNWQVNKTGNSRGTQNSVDQLYTYYNYSFMANATLKKSLSPYLFEGAQIFKGVTLTVEPGVVIKFYDRTSSLVVHGTLKAIGDNVNNIIFTSFRDDTAGGDSNNDATASTPVPGHWLGIYFSPDSVNSDLQYVDVRYGGAPLGFSPPGWQNAVWVDHSNIHLANSTIQQSDNRALTLQASNSTIDNVRFLHNNTSESPINESKAIFIQGGSPTIKNSLFDDNRYGIFIASLFEQATGATVAASPVIDNNNFTNNTYPVLFGAQCFPVFSNNQASGNSYNNIIINTDIAQSLTLQKGIPYLAQGVIKVSQQVTLTLQPGVIMEFLDSGSGLRVEGTLLAVGTGADQIIFRWRNFTSPFIAPGKWLGLRFTKTSTGSNLEYVNISYAGAYSGSQTNTDFSAAINVDQSAITLKNSVLENNANNGVWLQNSASIIDGVQFSGQNVSTVLVGAKAVYINGGSPTISNSTFGSNSYGIYIDLYHAPDGDIAATPDFSQNNTFSASQVGDIFLVP